MNTDTDISLIIHIFYGSYQTFFLKIIYDKVFPLLFFFLDQKQNFFSLFYFFNLHAFQNVFFEIKCDARKEQ